MILATVSLNKMYEHGGGKIKGAHLQKRVQWFKVKLLESNGLGSTLDLSLTLNLCLLMGKIKTVIVPISRVFGGIKKY